MNSRYTEIIAYEKSYFERQIHYIHNPKIANDVIVELSFKSWMFSTFHDGGLYHIETSPLICRSNQWTGFYMIGASVMKGLN